MKDAKKGFSGGLSAVSHLDRVCCVPPAQALLGVDGLKVEPSGAQLEGQLVKRENAEERDGTQVFICMAIGRRRCRGF